MKRCECHPAHGNRLPQHRTCGACGQLIYAWDYAPCDRHQTMGPREHIELTITKPKPDLRDLAAAQVAEARAARVRV
jgi:hypothetical protein